MRYGKYSFETPISAGTWGVIGDCLERMHVRLEEIRESMSIVRQAIEDMPVGEHLKPTPRIFRVPKGEAYASVESPRGIFGVYVKSSVDKYPARVKFRTPSFSVLGLFPKVLEGCALSDVPTIVASLDVIVSEVDR